LSILRIEKNIQVRELGPDSERMTICDWKQSTCCFELPYFEVLFHQIVKDTVLRRKERYEHAPKVEFLGSKRAFKEESCFLIAATCWRLLTLEQDMMNTSFIRAVWYCRPIGLARAAMQQYKSSFPLNVYQESVGGRRRESKMDGRTI
jgi:hypothetical protein